MDFDDLRAFVTKWLEDYPSVQSRFEKIASVLAKYPPPQPGDSLVIDMESPKTSALFFDRVWGSHGYPNEVGFFGHTAFELFAIATIVLRDEFRPRGDDIEREMELGAMVGVLEEDLGLKISDDKLLAALGRSLSEYLFTSAKISAPVLYNSKSELNKEYKPGNYETLLASISDLQVVDEENLDWKQVLEFRKDKNAKLKLRRLVHWLDTNMVGKSASQIADELAIRVEDYGWAIKKHGIKTTLGTLSTLLDSKTLSSAGVAGGSLALVGEISLGTLMAGAIVGLKCMAKIGQAWLDIKEAKRSIFPEVAYICEMKKRFVK